MAAVVAPEAWEVFAHAALEVRFVSHHQQLKAWEGCNLVIQAHSSRTQHQARQILADHCSRPLGLHLVLYEASLQIAVYLGRKLASKATWDPMCDVVVVLYQHRHSWVVVAVQMASG